MECIFFYKHKFYILHSVITAENILNEAVEDSGFKFKFEELKNAKKK